MGRSDRVKETYTHRGRWWLPDSPANTKSGTLTVEQGRATLDIEGDFGHEILEQTETSTSFAPIASSQDRILGVSTDGKRITLVDCRVAQGKMNFPGIPTTIYRAQFALIGAHFEDGEPIEFNAFDMRTSDLEAWVGSTPFGVEYTDPASNPEHTWLTVRVAQSEELNFESPLPNGQTVRIRLSIGTQGLGGFAPKAELEYTRWIGLQFPAPADLQQTLKAVTELRNFLTLAIGKPLTLLSIDGYCNAKVGPQDNPVPIKILYDANANPDLSERATLPWEMLFTFEQARDRLVEVLNTWFEHHDLLGPVFNLYFSLFYRPDLYLEQRFLGYAQAIETYDRLRRPHARERDAAEHKKLVAKLAAAAPDGEKNWL